jgi:hypothetical protein
MPEYEALRERLLTLGPRSDLVTWKPLRLVRRASLRHAYLDELFSRGEELNDAWPHGAENLLQDGYSTCSRR